jgi:hypothetical protein
MTETQDQRNTEQTIEPKEQKKKTPGAFEAKRAQNLRDNLARRKQQTRARQNSEDQ